MNFIVAVDQEWNIGKDGDLLQPISEDLKQFKARTLNRIVVLGRKTLHTFPGGKPLRGRTNIILTRQKDFLQTEPLYVIPLLNYLSSCAHTKIMTFS